MSDGASPEERLCVSRSRLVTDLLSRHAAKVDDDVLATEVLKGECDVNATDGLGMTALHYAAANASLAVLEILLSQEVDVDLQARPGLDTPLHLACQLDHPDARREVAASLLEAGADTHLTNRHKERAIDLLRSKDDEQLRALFRKAEAEQQIDLSAVAADDDDAGEASD